MGKSKAKITSPQKLRSQQTSVDIICMQIDKNLFYPSPGFFFQGLPYRTLKIPSILSYVYIYDEAEPRNWAQKSKQRNFTVQ